MWQKGDEPIPGYVLEKFLGRGTFGEVWRARAGLIKVALKLIDLSDEPGRRELRGVMRVKDIVDDHLMPINGLWMLDDDQHVMDENALRDSGLAAGSSDQAAVRTLAASIARKGPTTLVLGAVRSIVKL